MIKRIILSTLLICTSATQASNITHSISGSSSSAIQLDNSDSSNYEPTFNLNFGYDYNFKNGFELGGQLSTSIGDFNQLVFLIGPTFNFDSENINSSYYVSLRAGISTWGYHGFTEYTDTISSLTFGKRISLTEQISYTPGLDVIYIFNNDSDPIFNFQLFSFSVFF